MAEIDIQSTMQQRYRRSQNRQYYQHFLRYSARYLAHQFQYPVSLYWINHTLKTGSRQDHTVY